MRLSMRELARCIAWAVALGAPALLIAAFGGAGLSQADGFRAWAMLLVYAPHYVLGYAFGTGAAAGLSDSVFDASVLAAQFLYFLLIVAAMRFALRRKARRP